MAWNFKDEASLARWQEDMYKKWIPYEESKQYAIDNKMTFWDWKSVKMYTWWKGDNSWSSMEFKNWDEFQKIVNSIDTSKLSEDDLNSFYEALRNSKIWWINSNELWIEDWNKATSKQIDRAIKQKTTDKWYDELMWYYDDDDNEWNEDIYNEIMNSADLTWEQKKKKIWELSKNISDTRIKRYDEAWDDADSILEASKKNKSSDKLLKKTKKWDEYNYYISDKWMSTTKYNTKLNELNNIMSQDISDKKKKAQIKNLVTEINNDMSSVNLQYYPKYYWQFAKTEWLTDEQKKEKKMYDTYVNNQKAVLLRAKEYLNALQ